MKIGTLGHALLGLLAERDLTGYELTRLFDESLAHVWSAKHSQIYPELAKLQAGAMIAQSEAGPRGAKRYALTGDGRRELLRWMREDEPADGLRSEPLLRVFFLWTLPPAEAAAAMRREHARHCRQLAHLEALRDMPLPHAADRVARIALEAGLRTEAALVAWAAWAADQFDAAAASP